MIKKIKTIIVMYPRGVIALYAYGTVVVQIKNHQLCLAICATKHYTEEVTLKPTLWAWGLQREKSSKEKNKQTKKTYAKEKETIAHSGKHKWA